jgi:hypothetical protein
MTDWLGSAVIYSVPLYFILQAWFAYSWGGGWRIASLVPLIAIGPAIAYSLLALSRGSNLWPLFVVFLAPLGLIYLLIVWVIRAGRAA